MRDDISARRGVHVKLVSNSRVTMFNSLWPLCKMEVVNPPAFAQIIVIESGWDFLRQLNLSVLSSIAIFSINHAL